MERRRLAVRKRVGVWGSVYIIGGTEEDGELLPAEQADDLITRFDHEQSLFGKYHAAAGFVVRSAERQNPLQARATA